MDLRHLRYFLATAEEQSFSRAAERSHITQPALSESIRELETELGTELFIRSRRQVTLSWPGAILLDETRRILRMVDDAVRLTREASDADAVTLRIGVIEHQEPGILSKALARCRYLMELRPIIHVLPTALQLRAILEGHIDLGILVGPVRTEGVSADLLWQENLVAALLRGHALSKRSSAAIADFRDETLVVPNPSASPAYHDRLMELCRLRGFEPKRADHAFDLGTWLNQVAAGFGIAFVRAALDATRYQTIMTIPLDDADATIPIMVAWRRGDTSPALHAFVSALKSSRLSAAAGSSKRSEKK